MEASALSGELRQRMTVCNNVAQLGKLRLPRLTSLAALLNGSDLPIEPLHRSIHKTALLRVLGVRMRRLPRRKHRDRGRPLGVAPAPRAGYGRRDSAQRP